LEERGRFLNISFNLATNDRAEARQQEGREEGKREMTLKRIFTAVVIMDLFLLLLWLLTRTELRPL
jgi:hypothetical protein